jgi:hypothetical protein
MDVVALPSAVPQAATNGGPAVAVVKGTRIVRRRLPRLTSAQALSDRGACRPGERRWARYGRPRRGEGKPHRWTPASPVGPWMLGCDSHMSIHGWDGTMTVSARGVYRLSASPHLYALAVAREPPSPPAPPLVSSAAPVTVERLPWNNLPRIRSNSKAMSRRS